MLTATLTNILPVPLVSMGYPSKSETVLFLRKCAFIVIPDPRERREGVG
jgi:hypothetical protein